MMKKMEWIFLVGLVVASGVWWMLSRVPSRPKPSPQSPIPKAQSLLDSVLESPERLDGLAAGTEGIGAPVESVTVAPRPRLLSEVERPVRVRAKREPVSAESLYFWNDYASLRKAEIRDPDSEENRAGVVSLMQARQRRLGQK